MGTTPRRLPWLPLGRGLCWGLCCALWAASGATAPAAATAGGLTDASGLWERVQIHGFASLTGIRTSANRFFGDSPNDSFDFSEIGINVSARPSARLLLSGQILARRAGRMDNGTPSLDYGLADLTLDDSARHRLGVRVGRIKNPLGLYNETRDVPFTRPTIFLPQVIYFDKVRNLELSSDGMTLYGDWYGEHGNLALTLGAGRAVVDKNVEWVLLGDDSDGDLVPHGVTWVGSLWYSTPQERLKLGLSGLALSLGFKPGPASYLGPGQTDIGYVIASAQYNMEAFTLTAEYGRLPIEWQDYGGNFPYRKSAGLGYYLQGAYRLRPQLGLTLRYEEGFYDRRDRGGTRASAALGGAVPPFDYFSRIWTLGTRWDIGRHAMLCLDYQRHQGTYSLSTRENAPADLTRDWDLLALQIALRF